MELKPVIRRIDKGTDLELAAEFLSEIFSMPLSTDLLKKYSLSAHPSKQTFFLGAYVNNKISGCCAFIPYLIHSENHDLEGWQVAWAGVKPSFRNHGIFQQLVKQGEETCFLENADLMFAFPAKTSGSGPIFSDRLNFSMLQMKKTLVSPYTWFIQHKTFKPDFHHPAEADFFILQDRAKKMAGSAFWSMEKDGNRMFGVVKGSSLIIGEIRILSEKGFTDLMQETFKIPGLLQIRFCGSEQHPFHSGIRLPHFSEDPVMVKWNPGRPAEEIIFTDACRDTFGWL